MHYRTFLLTLTFSILNSSLLVLTNKRLLNQNSKSISRNPVEKSLIFSKNQKIRAIFRKTSKDKNENSERLLLTVKSSRVLQSFSRTGIRQRRLDINSIRPIKVPSILSGGSMVQPKPIDVNGILSGKYSQRSGGSRSSFKPIVATTFRSQQNTKLTEHKRESLPNYLVSKSQHEGNHKPEPSSRPSFNRQRRPSQSNGNHGGDHRENLTPEQRFRLAYKYPPKPKSSPSNGNRGQNYPTEQRSRPFIQPQKPKESKENHGSNHPPEQKPKPSSIPKPKPKSTSSNENHGGNHSSSQSSKEKEKPKPESKSPPKQKPSPSKAEHGGGGDHKPEKQKETKEAHPNGHNGDMNKDGIKVSEKVLEKMPNEIPNDFVLT